MSCGVTVLAGGAAELTEAKAPDAAMAVEPLSKSRRENRFIVVSSPKVVAPHPLKTRQRSGGR
jgi:hypothetical protein